MIWFVDSDVAPYGSVALAVMNGCDESWIVINETVMNSPVPS
jgi:hypothetical protein